MHDDVQAQVEAVLDVIAPELDAVIPGYARQRWPIIRFDYEGRTVVPNDAQLLAFARQIVTAIRTASQKEVTGDA